MRTLRTIRRRAAAFVMPFGALAVLACGDDDLNGVDDDDNANPVAELQAAPLSIPAGDGNQTVVTIDASASSDPDGDPLSFDWTVPSGTFVGGTTASDAVIQVTFPGAAPYRVTVVVSDGNGGTDTAEVTIDLL